MKGDRRLAVWGGVLLGLVTLAVAGAGWLAPRSPNEVPDEVAGRYLRPGSQRFELTLLDGRTLLATRVTEVAGGLEVDRLGRRERFAGREVESVDRRTYLLGTDRFGRDLWSRLLHGGRISLRIGLLAGALSLVLGVLLGAVAAGSGGAVDALLMRLTDALLALPHLLIVVALAAVFDAGATHIALILGVTGWMATARLVRAEILSLRGREFVLAANAVGRSSAGVLFRHLLPNALTPVIAYTALRIGDLILVEASLSFLGLGVEAPDPTWGNMISEGSDALTTAWWVAVFPGLAIATTVVSFHLLGDGLRAWLDPRSRSDAPC